MKLLTERMHVVLSENPGLDGAEGQAGLAKAAGASKSVVNQWLHGGIKSIAIDYALNIESNLGYNHIWLMTGRGEIHLNTKTTHSSSSSLDESTAAVVEMMRATDVEGRILAKNAVIDALTGYKRRQSEMDFLTGRSEKVEVVAPRVGKRYSSGS